MEIKEVDMVVLVEDMMIIKNEEILEVGVGAIMVLEITVDSSNQIMDL